MLTQCAKDIRQFGEGLFTKEDLDARFGKGQWRLLRRFMLGQSFAHKWRAIVDALFSGHPGADNHSRIPLTDAPS